MDKPKSIIVNVQEPDKAKAKAVVAQLERLFAENEAQHTQMVNGAKNAVGRTHQEFYVGMQAAYAHYGDGLKDAITVIRTAFDIPEEFNEIEN